MNKVERTSLVIFPILLVIAALFGLAGSQGSSTLLGLPPQASELPPQASGLPPQASGLPLFGLLVALALLIQWLAFVPAFLRQTEKFYDITGSLTYILVATLGLIFSPKVDLRGWLLWALVLIWAVRLGSFLFGRIHKAGKDDRFDEIKPLFFRFLNTWTIQGLWVIFTVSAALVGITTSVRKELDAFALVGFLLWAVGFAIEVIADTQKSRFNADPANRGKFIRSGLWAKSRHPNYFGEILLWVGVTVIALPVLQGWQWVALISPLFVTLLLTRVSGIPLLEKKAERKWGGQPDYEEYKKSTPVLIPKL